MEVDEVEIEDDNTTIEETNSISVRSFVAARAQEIVALASQIQASSSVTSKGLAFQHVPKHMRRRAVSHNVKRLPKRLQPTHLAQLSKSSGGPSKKPKKPSRKYRRRKSNLLLEYNRRQRKNGVWLETHIWHAKRFHMENKWGYKLPVAPCDKGYRAIYRAFRSFAAMRDISFYSCIELKGSFKLICDQFKLITSPNVDKLGIGAKYFTVGRREGTLHIFRQSEFPFGFIGQIKFMWLTQIPCDEKQSILWIWIHPGFKAEVMEELIDIFKLDPEPSNFIKEPDIEAQVNDKISIDELKLLPKKLTKRPQWSSPDIEMTDLEGALNRIQIVGPQSTLVLKDMLQVASQTEDEGNSWSQEYFQNNPKIQQMQFQLWEMLTHTTQVPSNIVLPLVVRDPRVFLPQKRTKTETNGRVQSDEDPEKFWNLLDEFVCLKDVHLADPLIRQRATEEKMTDLEFSKRRGELLIPGTELRLGKDENQVPVILVNQSSNKGWDLILPAGWAMSFWINLSYRCVRTFGIRDALHHAFEFGSIHSETFFGIDSNAGDSENILQGQNLKDSYFKFPPDKRQNLLKLKSPFPFEINWKTLLHFWKNQIPDSTLPNIYVLRDFTLLGKLRKMLSGESSGEETEFSHPQSDCCLVGVKVEIIGKGKITQNSLICMPVEADVSWLSVKEEIQPYQEPAFQDNEVEKLRKTLRQKHQKYMAYLRKKRRKLRKSDDPSDSNIELYDSTEPSRRFNEEIEAIYTPNPQLVLNSMSRKVIGVVTVGGECYTVGKCCGLGYVSLNGLINLIKVSQSLGTANKVLVRDCSKSLTYRISKISIS